MSKPFRVRVGNASLKCYPHEKGWRFAYRDGERWRYITRRKRGDITDAAEDVLKEQATGFIWTGLDGAIRRRLEWLRPHVEEAKDWDAIKAFIESRASSEDIAASVARYVDHKTTEAGHMTRHLGQVEAVLESLAGAFHAQRVSDISTADLAAWLDNRTKGLGSKRKRDIRGMLVSFWNWCRLNDLVADAVTAPERLPSPKVEAGDKRVLTPDELCGVLNAVREEFRAWVVLGAFAGLRPEEIAPQPATRRRGLHIEEIDWRFKVIRIPAEVAGKVKRPRVVPMCDVLLAGLEWAGIEEGQTGPIVLGDPSNAETRRLGKLLFGGKWPQDSLRHSFGSYRNALVRSLQQVAEEMGTSETMLHRHYHNPRAEEEGEAWFGVNLTPDGWGVLKSSDQNEVQDGQEQAKTA